MDPHRRLLTARRAATVGRIAPIGPNFYDAAGTLVVRKSITAFTLPKRKMEGRGDEALRFLDFAAREGFNEVRFFASVDWTGPPGPGVESGWSYDEDACAWVLDQAKTRGLRCEVTALTFDSSMEAMVQMVENIDLLCIEHDNALLEVSNEPSRNDIDIAGILQRYTPGTPGWASGRGGPTPFTSETVIGQTDDGKPIYGPTAGSKVGPALTHHSGRDREWPRKFKDAYEFGTGAGPEVVFSPGYPGPVMLDEPPQVEQTIRDQGAASAADDWTAYGAGCAFFGCGGTMHSNPGFQQCVVPTDPAVLACVRGFIAGLNAVPAQIYTGYDRGEPPTPSDGGSRRYFRWNLSGQKWEICVRPFSFRKV